MKDFTVDVCGKHFCKHDEDTCGDSFKVFHCSDSTVIVLSDGLGSGVKANVLSTLTVEIIGGLVSGNLTTHEIVETLIATLPVCKWRGIAYSTFSILRIYDGGQATLVEYDSPKSIKISKDEKITTLNGSEIEVLGKTIRECHFRLNTGDIIMQMSDGIIHAGIGASLRMGWQEEGVQSYLKHVAPLAEGKPEKLSGYVIKQAYELWQGNSGDDGTVLSTKYRKALNAIVMTGPASSREETPKMIKEYLSSSGVKIVSGGTTSHLIAEALKTDLEIDMKYIDSGLPPTAKIKGIDLVTEGMLTLNKVVEYLKNGIPENIENAATKMLDILVSCDGVRFMVGTARNSAHQNASFPAEMLLRRTVVETLSNLLKSQGKLVEIDYF